MLSPSYDMLPEINWAKAAWHLSIFSALKAHEHTTSPNITSKIVFIQLNTIFLLIQTKVNINTKKVRRLITIKATQSLN